MSKSITLTKGFDIKLVGAPAQTVVSAGQPETFSLRPSDFVGFGRPKVLVKEGDTVQAGDPIFFDREMDSVMYTAPVSGEVVEIRRGEKRKLTDVVILADKQTVYKQFPKQDIASLSVEAAKATLLESGIWPQILQRPYAVVANPEVAPRAIFVSCFDSAPLAPDYEFVFKGQERYLQAGIDVLKKFTKGAFYLGLNGKKSGSLFASLKGVETVSFSGPHPAGNVGVQIHHIAPIKDGSDVVWTLTPYALVQIGKLFLEGIYDAKRLVAVTGPRMQEPAYVEMLPGAKLDKLAAAKVKGENVRIVSGNVLTGESVGAQGFLGYYASQVTALEEGNRPRFFLSGGWLSFISDRLSFHKAFGLMGSKNKEYSLDTSLNGERRAFVVSGVFEKVMPMDILPTYLIKAAMANDYEEMEALGIYEVAEEDFALCEFVDVSKHNIQQIIREGLDMLRLS